MVKTRDGGEVGRREDSATTQEVQTNRRDRNNAVERRLKNEKIKGKRQSND
jgi:hypothetical protein